MITCTLQGRAGNQFYILAHMIAYAKKHNLEYYIPDTAYHCDGNKMYFPHLANGPELQGLQEYHELTTHATPNRDGTFNYNTPAYQDIPKMDNVKFVGYWQSFEYFDWCRDYILEKFQIDQYDWKGYVSIHIRRGDFLQLVDKHPVISLDYYIAAIRYFLQQGYKKFRIYSDDIPWCIDTFTNLEPKHWLSECNITFSESMPEINDLTQMSNCEHQILCYSTFGFVAAWLNQNPDKQVIIPPARYCFSGANANFIPSTFTQLEF